MNADAVNALPGSRRNPILRLFTSIWFGIVLLAVILIYSTLISAVLPVRTTLEMTEMQAYRHWFFVTAVVLFVLSLMAVTFLRSRWASLNAGSLVAHIGLLILCGGALLYFGRKVEGDVLLRTPEISFVGLTEAGAVAIGRIPAQNGQMWAMPEGMPGQPMLVTVTETYSSGVQSVATATLRIETPSGVPQEVKLSAGDARPVPLSSGLAVRLNAFPGETCFYDHELAALYFRDLTKGTETVQNIATLPLYKPHYPTELGVLLDSAGKEVRGGRQRPEVQLGGLTIPTGWFERWRMPIAVNTEGLPFSAEIIGFVPYAVGEREAAGVDGVKRKVPIVATEDQRRMASSAILVRFTGRGEAASWSETRWVQHSIFPRLEEQAERVTLPSGGQWDVVFSRAQHPLGATLVGYSLTLTYFPGQRGIESFRSDFLVRRDGGEPYAEFVKTNRTCELGAWTLYQSSYDSDEMWRYTVLGVGNRHGIVAMNVGWILVAAGCVYAFYVKPVLLRRARQRGGAAPRRMQVAVMVVERAS